MPIRPVQTSAELDTARQLFREYARELDVDLCFQDFEQELQALPGPYAAPQGVILLAHLPETLPTEAVGCVALKPLDRPDVCEMKRLYVRPEARDAGWGNALVDAILNAARRRSYSTMRLDTLDTLRAALRLYRRFGFKEIDAYYENPLPNVIYMQKTLSSSSPTSS